MSKSGPETEQQDPDKLIIDRDLMVTLAGRIGMLDASLKYIRRDAEGVLDASKYIEKDIEILNKIWKQIKEGTSLIEGSQQPNKGE